MTYIMYCLAMAKIGHYFEICKKKEKNLQETEQKCGKSGKFGWFIRKKDCAITILLRNPIRLLLGAQLQAIVYLTVTGNHLHQKVVYNVLSRHTF